MGNMDLVLHPTLGIPLIINLSISFSLDLNVFVASDPKYSGSGFLLFSWAIHFSEWAYHLNIEPIQGSGLIFFPFPQILWG
jgi:hypothetical protein